MRSSTGTPHPSRAGGPYTGMPAVPARAARRPLVVTGVAALVPGVPGMAWPGVTLLAVGVLFGIAHGVQPRVHDRQPT